MRQLAILICSVLWINVIQSQTMDQAYRFSSLDVQGTGRYLAVGSSMGAIGADVSTAAMNPAGLGFFRSSEFVFTPGMGFTHIQSTLNGQAGLSLDQTKSKFIIGSTGMVNAREPQFSPKLKSAVFAIAANRTADFNQSFTLRGNTNGSIVERWTNLANGLEPDELDGYETGLAYSTGAIFDPNNSLNYTNDFNSSGNYETSKLQTVTRKGGVTELDIAFAGNLQDKLMFGVNFGIPFLRYEEQKVYTEDDVNNEVNDPNTTADFKSLTYGEYLNSSATGFNIKMGLIYRFAQAFRLGVAVHSPTWYGLKDAFGSDLNYDFTTNPPLDPAPPYYDEFDGSYEYAMSTPWRFIGSVGSVISKYGFINADVEYVNYQGAKFNFNDVSGPSDIIVEEALNRQIDEQFQSAINLRIGAEIALMDFRLRGGFQLLGSPFEGDDNYRKAFSGGVGFRHNSFYMDLGYRYMDQTETYIPYDPRGSTIQAGVNDITNHQVNLTFGFRY